MGSITDQDQMAIMPFLKRILNKVNKRYNLIAGDGTFTRDLPSHEVATVQDLENACFRLALDLMGHEEYSTVYT
jgi:hypothetical protein